MQNMPPGGMRPVREAAAKLLVAEGVPLPGRPKARGRGKRLAYRYPADGIPGAPKRDHGERKPPLKASPRVRTLCRRLAVLSLRIWLAGLPAGDKRTRAGYVRWQLGNGWTAASSFGQYGGFAALRREAAAANAAARRAAHFELARMRGVSLGGSAIGAGRATTRGSVSMAENIELLRERYERFSNGDIEGATDLWAEDFVWEGGSSTELPGGGRHEGKQAALAALGQAVGAWDSFELSADEFLADGDTLVVLGHTNVSKGGASEQVPVVHIWRMEGDEIKRLQILTDTYLTARLLGLV